MSDQAILQALRNCNPNEALEPTDPRFHDFDAVRGVALRRHFSRLMMASEMAVDGTLGGWVKIAIAGHRGGGKSTEVNRLQGDLKDQGYFVIVQEADMVLNKNDITFSDIIRLILMALDDSFGDLATSAGPVHDAFQSVLAWYQEVTQTKTKVLTDARELGLGLGVGGQVGAEATADAGIGLKIRTDLGRLLASFNVVSKSEGMERKEIRDLVERYPDQLVANLNDLLRALRHAADDRLGRGLVLILDNVDRYDGEVIDQAFIRHAGLYQGIEAHLAFTIHSSFLHKPHRGSVSDGFTPLELPMLPVFEERSRNPRPEVVAEIRRAVYQRVPLELFAAESIVDRFILQSGGCWRDLLRLLQAALLNTEGPISQPVCDYALGSIAQTFHRLIQSEEQMQVLVKTHRTHEVVSDENTRHLLFHRCILNYNGRGWYDVHPLIESYSGFQTALAAPVTPPVTSNG